MCENSGLLRGGKLVPVCLKLRLGGNSVAGALVVGEYLAVRQGVSEGEGLGTRECQSGGQYDRRYHC